jgi:hypothetical protein
MGRVDYPVKKLLDRLPRNVNHLSVNWLLQHYLARARSSHSYSAGGKHCPGKSWAPATHPWTTLELLTLATSYMEGALVQSGKPSGEYGNPHLGTMARRFP